MPQSNYNSSSTLVLPEQAQASLGQHSAQTATKEKDWFYGTEELLDALPKAWTRSMLYLLVSFAAIALPWTMFSQVDETGNAIGRIEPKGATQKLDSVVTGSVIAVNVTEGATVKAGQVLVEIESDVLQTELQQTKAKLEGLLSREGQIKLLKNQVLLAINIQEQQNQSQNLAKLAQLNQARQNLDAKQSAYHLQKLEKLAQVDQVKQNINSNQIAHRLAKSRLSRDLSEVSRYRTLLKAGAIPQTKVVELEKTAEDSERLQEEATANIQQSQLRLREEFRRYQSIMNQAQSDIEQAKLRLQEEESSYQGVIQSGQLTLLKNQEQVKDLQTQITSLQSEITQTQSQITSLQLQLQQRVVRSPIDGIIFELPIKKPGSVVQPGQMMAQVAPKNATLILKAQMPSQQSGFVKVGMPVKIKFDAYPFQEYGVTQGRVTWISPDSKIQENSPNRLESYDVEIALEQPYIQTGNKRIPLTPGQTATAEVIVRQRRVIDFILDPFKKLKNNGLEL
ncbi:HlyD family efflux transporter periplasmic adaptor subunit [Anabaena cylindrica FACHB-243]|uniref:Secretion protein HlyD family protein n=1 Tax=Anabaena cylindrica (strain ATCC 27899 / PCC 7122) TaxID=272123 RepID=K9ZAL0_ANACC|nr:MULTISPECIES: HlyD family efflux transporter periplasmic adaptor subunit [Anabaena]AFZ55764.1 secretion protein HlyD family protein [Anabaena cylindrica PCC 7122]MBD2420235.1 HlyD family efflux transporter periplasmic adaptor subunit [Anabaena cylindrica FACHB-243]MBY5283106.1 HlyD family efflux transporter periplasmic adaptor subunit [Anabaena sp. CCAP 1446/1C]MBY5307822.1 HlyD family efflux transporter periplasmic adaptor subunit [Anabaena sp. CCAP 1446/1C]MCM2406113.1 HlyD family efflux 